MDKRCLCTNCGKLINNKSNLAKHMKDVHKITTPKPKIMFNDEDECVKFNVDSCFLCTYCGKLFVKNSSLAKHMKVVHNETIPNFQHEVSLMSHDNDSAVKVTHLCTYCDKAFVTNSSLVRHRKNMHNIKNNGPRYSRQPHDRMEFKCLSDFFKWKEEVEVETNSSYKKARGIVKRPNCVHMYYDCCRSGICQPKVGKRKNRPSKKINGICPAKISVQIRENSIIVKHFKKHTHSVHVPEDVEVTMAGKLHPRVGVQRVIEPKEEIYSSYKDEIEGFVESFEEIETMENAPVEWVTALDSEGKMYKYYIDNVVESVEEIETMENTSVELLTELTTEEKVLDRDDITDFVESVEDIETMENTSVELVPELVDDTEVKALDRDDIKEEFVESVEEIETMESASVELTTELDTEGKGLDKYDSQDFVESSEDVETMGNTLVQRVNEFDTKMSASYKNGIPVFEEPKEQNDTMYYSIIKPQIPETATYDCSITDGALMFVNLYEKNKTRLSVEDNEQLHKHLDSMINIVTNKLGFNNQTQCTENYLNRNLGPERLVCVPKNKRKMFILGKLPLEKPTSNETNVINLLRSSVGLDPITYC